MCAHCARAKKEGNGLRDQASVEPRRVRSQGTWGKRYTVHVVSLLTEKKDLFLVWGIKREK